MGGIVVDLTPAEYHHAAHAGFIRCLRDTLDGVKDRRPSREGRFDVDVLGAVAEFSVAKALGRFWGGPGKMRGPDCGGSVEVRATHHENGCLLLKHSDMDSAPYVLVTVTGQKAVLRGWVWGREGKQERYWGDPYNTSRPAFWVPQSDLHDMADLPAIAMRVPA